jgi:hypothetical protein
MAADVVVGRSTTPIRATRSRNRVSLMGSRLPGTGLVRDWISSMIQL